MRRNKKRTSARATFSSVAEALEPRRLLAILSGTGTSGDDIISISVSAGTVRLVINGVPLTMLDSNCTGVQANGGGGNDQIGVGNNTDNPVTINGGSGNDTILLAQSDLASITANVEIDGGTSTSTAGDLVILNDSAGTGTGAYTIGTTGFTHLPAGLVAFNSTESFQLTTNNLGTTINVLGTGTGSSLITANGGDDTIVLGSSVNRYSSIQGITVNGGAGTDAIRVDDQGQASESSFTITSTSFDSNNGGQTDFTAVESITINGGGGDNAHVIETVSASTAITLNCGSGNDTAQVTPGSQLIADIDGPLTINGQGGVDSLTYFDDANFGSLNYMIGGDTLTSTMMSATTTYLQCETVTLNGTISPASYDVQGSTDGTTLVLNAGDESDAFNLNLPGTSGMQLFGDLTCNGGGGVNYVRLFDQFHTEPTRYDVTTTFLRASSGGTLGPFLEYTSATALSIFTGGDVDDSFGVHSLAADVSLTIFAASGILDTLGLSPTDGDMDLIHGPIEFNHDGDGSFTTFFDDHNTTPVTYSYAPGQPVTRTGFAGLTGFGESLNIYAGTAGDTFVVNGAAADEYIYCNGSDGNDSASFGNGTLAASFLGDVVFDGEAGTDSLVIDGSAETTGYGYSYSNGLIHPSFRANFSDGFNSIDNESFVLKTGSGSDGISVTTGVAEVVAIELYAGAGADIINVLRSPSPVVVDAGSGNNQLYVDADGGATGQALLPTSQFFQFFQVLNSGVATVAPGGDKVLTAQFFDMSATATLDLNDNDFIVDYDGASQLAMIQSRINAARAGGAWTGQGITSTAAKNAGAHNTTLGALEATTFKSVYGAAAQFDGQTIDNTTVLVKYTYYGDTDFNGKVDGADYARLDAKFNQQATLGSIGGWFNGDFDGNGKVDGADYALIDAAFNSQSGTLRPGSRGGRLSTMR